jgi:hypothetical protein
VFSIGRFVRVREVEPMARPEMGAGRSTLFSQLFAADEPQMWSAESVTVRWFWSLSPRGGIVRRDIEGGRALLVHHGGVFTPLPHIGAELVRPVGRNRPHRDTVPTWTTMWKCSIA